MVKVAPRVLLLLIFICLSNFSAFAQLDLSTACNNAQPFCSDEARELTFSNVFNEDINFQALGCLDSTRNPSWYFIRIDQSGELIFDIQQWVDSNGNRRLNRSEQQLDVDFIAWGPFTTSFINCEDLAQGCDTAGDDTPRPAECVNNVDDPLYYVQDQDNTNIIDCSFARNTQESIFIETLTIPNAQSGEYYFILVTNFSDETGVIQLQQTNLEEDNAGTTDCSILEPGIAPERIAVCGASDFPLPIEGRFPGAVSYQWQTAPIGTTNFTNLGGLTNRPLIDVTAEGVYQLIGYSDPAGTVEVGRDEVVVIDVSAVAIEVSENVAEESFAGSYTITAEITTTPDIQALGFNDFEYRLDRDLGNGFIEYRAFQPSPIFSDVPPGDYNIVARYQDCPDNEAESGAFMILGYPKYFTPNGDTIHETWNVINLENQSATALIYIFDRYGKLLKQLRSDGPGWDGTYNGKNMPSSDYWFRVEFNEPTDPNMRRRVFAGNFSLIR